VKKYTYFKIIVIFFILYNVHIYSQFGGGNGTASSPYEIYTKEHLEELADSVDVGNNYKNEYFKLMNDINDSIRTVIGYERKNIFQGNFNGNNKKITLAIDGIKIFWNGNWITLTNDFIGLFASLYEAKIYDLIIDGFINGNNCVGGICGGGRNSNIFNCINYCKIEGMSDRISGICGSMMYGGNISNCTNYGIINGNEYIGGICGYVYNANISNCVNYENIEGRKNVGGICGSFLGEENDIIKNCINYGNIKGINEYVGGIGGFCGYGLNMSNCKNLGNILGNKAVGGITGCFGGDGVDLLSKLLYCENKGNVSGVRGVGGISGHLHYGDIISYCINIGTVTADSIVAGIVGGSDDDNLYFDKTGNIYNSINSGLIVGKHIVGGIIGKNKGAVKNCINTGTVKGNTKTGCIVGENEGGTIENCHYDKQMCSGEKE